MQDAPGRFCAVQAVWHHSAAHRVHRGRAKALWTKLLNFVQKLWCIFACQLCNYLIVIPINLLPSNIFSLFSSQTWLIIDIFDHNQYRMGRGFIIFRQNLEISDIVAKAKQRSFERITAIQEQSLKQLMLPRKWKKCELIQFKKMNWQLTLGILASLFLHIIDQVSQWFYLFIIWHPLM